MKYKSGYKSVKTSVFWLIVVIALFMLTGCLEHKQTSSQESMLLINSLTFVKSKHGICFGVGDTSQMPKGRTVTYLIVPVDCNTVGL